MFKNLVIHPFLFSLFPILFIFQHNIHEIPLQDIFLPLLISFIIVLGLWVILRFFIGGKKAGLIASLLFMLFIIYSNLHTFILNTDSEFSFLGRNMILGVIFLILLIVGIVYFVKTKRILDNVNSITNVIALSLIGFLAVSIPIYYLENPIDYSISYFSEELPSTVNDIPAKPDIYYFVFDEYAGKITLEEDFNYDNTDFLKKLQDRGFYIPDVSYSSYPGTLASIASTLNMGYLDILTEILGKNSKDTRLLIEIKDNSLVMNLLKLHNYKIISFYGGFDATGNTKLVSKKLCSYLAINNDLKNVIVLTYLPVTYFNNDLIHGFQREQLECVFLTLPNIKGSEEAPVFVMIHLMFPHHSYIYDSEGNPVEDEKEWEDKEAYLEQLKYTNTKILELADQILENSTREPVIIITSDHGFRPGIDWKNPSAENYRAGFNNLGAYYLPNQMDNLPEIISGVNIFRIVFNSYLGTEYEMLEDKHFWFDPDRPFDYTDVADKLPK